MTEKCVVCGRKKMFDGEGGYTVKDSSKGFLFREKDNIRGEAVWVCCWNCYEKYRADVYMLHYGYESEEVEEIAKAFHSVYQAEAIRQGDKRHPDDYESLSENVKEYDRVLVFHVLRAFDLALFEIDRKYGNEIIPLEDVWELFKEKLKDVV